jgi:hypothetical protein
VIYTEPCFWPKRVGDGVKILIFAPLKFFLFSGGAKFGEFRLTSPAQVVCGSPVRESWWGEIV